MEPVTAAAGLDRPALSHNCSYSPCRAASNQFAEPHFSLLPFRVADVPSWMSKDPASQANRGRTGARDSPVPQGRKGKTLSSYTLRNKWQITAARKRFTALLKYYRQSLCTPSLLLSLLAIRLWSCSWPGACCRPRYPYFILS